MPGLWKAWKAQGRLPTLSTSPLGISPQAGRDSHIPTAPAPTADGKLENQKQVFQFPTATIPLSQNRKHKTAGGLRPPPAIALRAWLIKHTSCRIACALRALDIDRTQPTKGEIAQHSYFRLIPHWNRTAGSGSSPIGINS
jgi:hypothetical protein